MQERLGGCLCGRVRFCVTGEPVVTAICHCRSCRRATGAPAVAWAMFARSAVAFTTTDPASHPSSPGTDRGFCERCGTSLCYESESLPGLIDLTVGAFDEPESLPPQIRIWQAHRLGWMADTEALPGFDELPDERPG